MGVLLDNINSPMDIQSLSVKEMEMLSGEIRELIIRTVSRTGGHLAPSLGTVELTLAIHHVFTSKEDLVIWDVGHQAYAHKIITGRRESFETMRTMGGISGFPRIDESPYDAFGAGHSSTSISAALGITSARCIKDEPGRVVAVIGDGAMTGGQAFEGLNQAGHLNKNIIVILNDNEMSISPNVGALSSFLSRKLSKGFVVRLKKEIEIFLRSFPGIGEDMVKIARKAEDAIKGFITPGMHFEAMNFQYFGPINGHRIDRLVETLGNIKNIDAPIIVHVMTKKGKGYPPAEENPSKFHGVGPFDVKTGAMKDTKPDVPTYTQVFGKTLTTLAENNPKIVAITAAMTSGTGLTGFAEGFPERFFDVGIAEQHAITFAAGLATQGFVPVVAIYSTFLQRAYDQILHDVCLQKLPVVLAIDRGGIVGEDGPTHNGLFDIAYLRNIPGLLMMSPEDENELAHMLLTAVESGRPVALRYPRGKGRGVKIDDELRQIEIGRAKILRGGDDITIVALGPMVAPALEAAKRLSSEGVEAAVINARFIKPLDIETIKSVAKKSGKVITVEEGVLSGGFGSAVMEGLADFPDMGIIVKRMGVGDEFVEQGSRELLLDRYGLSPEGIFKTATQMIAQKSKGQGKTAYRTADVKG